ncbi:MAG TPA: hypothetical protein ENJ37_05405 [Deltaproteobacteria bacterium]|nr:hypothetical protein [Deltaproteobacteria bacterium]
MKEILEGLTHVDGVFGAVLHDGKAPVVQTPMDGLDAEDAARLGEMISQAFVGSKTMGLDAEPSQLVFAFDSRLVVSRSVSGGLYLNVFCNSGATLPSVEVSTKLAAAELRRVISAQAQATKKKAGASVEQVMAGPLSFPISGLQDLLCRYIGPAAVIVVRECVKEWLDRERASLSGLSRLVELLAEEVEAADRRRFVSEAGRIIESWS